MNQLCICTIKTPNEELKCYYDKHFVLFPFFPYDFGKHEC